jgi:tetratricopeptide (TPR) repeat protein
VSWIINYNTDGGFIKPPELSPEDEYRRSLDFEIWFYEGILAKCSNYVEVLQAVGNSYTARGYYEKGLWVDLKLSKLCPSDCIVFYNLACSYSLIGELERAFDCIRRSIDLGYDDLSHMSNDPDLRNLRGDSRYDEIVELIASRQKPRE